MGSTKTFFLYDGADLVGEFTASGTVKATNTYGVNGLAYRRVGSLSTYYAFDPMGNAVNAQSLLSAPLLALSPPPPRLT